MPKPKKKPSSTLTPLTDEQVSEIAMGIFKNEIFTDGHLAERDKRLLLSVFMPLGLMSRAQKFEMMRKMRPGMFYAEMSKAGPRAINGYPMFFEVSMASEEDTAKIWTEYQRLQASIPSAIVPS
jgi:hypothetical protein